MYRVLVAQPTVVAVGIGDYVRGEHVISNGGSHIPPPSSNNRHSREGGNPGSQGSRRWPPVQARGRLWTPASAGVTKTRFAETRAVPFFISSARIAPSRRQP